LADKDIDVNFRFTPPPDRSYWRQQRPRFVVAFVFFGLSYLKC